MIAKTHIKRASVVVQVYNPSPGEAETAGPQGLQASQPTKAVSPGLTKRREAGKMVPQIKTLATRPDF